MKKNFKIVLAVMILATAFMFSCSKDEDEPIPEYAGTWESAYTDYGYYTTTGKVDMKSVLELSAGNFTMIEKEKVGDSFVDIEGLKGSLSVKNAIMTTKITQYASDEDMEDESYVLTWYKDGSTEFVFYQALLEAFGGSLTSEWAYTLDGDNLTLVIDEETMIYTRIK